MKTRSQAVVCTSCSTKFHVPDELVRGKLVKFRCRKCGGTIDVDGRISPRAQAPRAAQPPPHETPSLETPASFSERTLPPQPTSARSGSISHLHPWPEPPRTQTSTAPLAISEPPPPLASGEPMRDPSNRGPKIAAFVALVAAAGLSVLGFSMRTSPSDTTVSTGLVSPVDPALTPRAAARNAADLAPPRSERATKVTDLPAAVDGVAPSIAARAPLPKAALPSEGPTLSQEQGNEPASPSGPATPAARPEIAGREPSVPQPNTAQPNTAQPNTAQPKTAETNAAAPGAAPPSIAPAVIAEPAAPPAPPPLAPPAAVAAPTPISAPAPVTRPRGDFNTTAAREALEDGAARASSCKTIDTPSGMARLAVTFAPTGHVTQAIIESGPFVGTAAGSCIAAKFRALKITPYTGDSVTVHRSIPF